MTSETDRTGKLGRRLWTERIIFLLLLAFLVALLRGLIPGGKRVSIIAVDGEAVAVVATPADAERLLDDIKDATGVPASRVTFAQRVTIHSAPAGRDPVQSDLDALKALNAKLEPVVQAAAILADGVIVVGAADQQEAVRALSLLQRKLSPAGAHDAVFFKQQVKIDLRDVPASQFFPTAQAAVAHILQQASPKQTRDVAPGESAWKIARDYNVSLSALAQANPGVDLNRLRAGARLNIPGEPIPVTVVARKEIQEAVGEGPLRRTQTVRITYENGVEVSREVIARQRRPAPAPQPRSATRRPWRWGDEIPR